MAANNSRNLRIRVRPYLADLKARNRTNRDVASLLDCDEATLCRVLKSLDVKKDAPVDRAAAKDLSKQRREFREHVANTMTPEDAAKAANVSVRTIYRYINK